MCFYESLYHSLYKTRYFITILSLFLTSCGGKTSNWEYHEVRVGLAEKNSARLVFYPESIRPPFSMEITRSKLGITLYLNILRMEASPHPDYFKKTSLDICVNGEKMTVHPYLLKGGQRLLFSEEVKGVVLEALLKGDELKIKMGARDYVITPDGFSEVYSQLQQLDL
jgi:hypothetical protein